MPDEDKKRFTQGEVNDMLGKQKRLAQQRHDELERKLAEYEEQRATLTARVGELETERDHLAKKVAAHRSDKAATQLTAALTKAGALNAALPLASREFVAAAELERDDDDNLVAITYGGKRHTSLEDAARVFLSSYPFFARGGRGGSGSGRPIGLGGGRAPEEESIPTPADLARAGWAEVPR